jgi:DNA-binding beta-propeller fold protein YncE
VATIPTPLAGQYASIAFGEGAVWVTSGQADGVVYRVDPAANRVTAAIGVPGGAFGIVVAAGTVWVTQYLPEADPGIVARIDARSNRLLSPVEVPNMPGMIRYGLDAVWVTSRFTVSRIDPHSGVVTQPLHRVGDVRAIGAGSLWGTFADSEGDFGVQRIDPGIGRVVATIRIRCCAVMAFGLGTLWLAGFEEPTVTPGGNEPARPKPPRLYRIDPATNRVLGRPVPLPGGAPTALAVGDGAVWVGEQDGTTLTRFNLVP